MNDYSDLQKRCQRGASNLADANNLLAECYAALGTMAAQQNNSNWDQNLELKTENEALRKVAAELRRWACCQNLHHDKRDQHESDEPCKVLARIDAAMSKEG